MMHKHDFKAEPPQLNLSLLLDRVESAIVLHGSIDRLLFSLKRDLPDCRDLHVLLMLQEEQLRAAFKQLNEYDEALPPPVVSATV